MKEVWAFFAVLLLRRQESGGIALQPQCSEGQSNRTVPKRISQWERGPQKGPAERGHVKKRQKVSKRYIYICIFSTLFDILAQGQKRQKLSRIFFDTFRLFLRGTSFAAPFGGPIFLSCATGALWGCVTPFHPSLSKHLSSVLEPAQSSVTRFGKTTDHPQRKPPLALFDKHLSGIF